MNYIVLYNNLTYSLAVLVFLSTLLHSTKQRYIIAFIIIMAAGLLLTNSSSLIMPVVFVLLTICFAKNRNEYCRIFYKCLTAITVSFFVISTMSGLVMLIIPKQLYSNGYNLFMGAMLLISAMVVKYKSSIMDWCRELEHYGYAIALEFVVLIFFSFVLPIYYPVIAQDSIRRWGVFILSFMLMLIIVSLLINSIKNLEYGYKELVLYIEQRKSYAEKVNAQFEKIVTLKHYYNKLYQSIVPFIRDKDIDGLQQYYECYVTPIHKDLISNSVQLSDIKNELIRNLIDFTTGQATMLENLTYNIDILGEIKLPDSIELDVFELLSNFIDNAVRELFKQDHGLLRIEFRVIDRDLSIQIANTLDKAIDIEALYLQEEKDGHGYGLKRVREIVYQQQDIKHFTYKDGMFEGKEILVQQIVITIEGGCLSV